MLEFNVINQTLKRVDKFSPATDSVDYLVAKFNFLTDDWDGKAKKALFRSGTVSYEAAIGESGTCVVPWETLVAPDNKFSALSGGCVKIYVTVVGTLNTVTLPTKECRVEIAVSGLTETLNGAEPTPNIYEQFVTTVQADNDATVAEIRNDNDETAAEINANNADTVAAVDALAERAETAATSAEQSAASMKNDYANALKGTASGEVVRVDDVSPVEHTVKVKIGGEGVDPSTVTVTRCGKNIIRSEKIANEQWKNAPSYESHGVLWNVSDDRKLTIQGETPEGNYSVFDIATSDRFTNWLVDGATYTASLNKTGNGGVELVAEIFDRSNGKVITYIRDGATFTVDKGKYTYGTLRLQITPSTTVNVVVMPQIEIGLAITGFEPYNGATYTPAADGSCDVVSVSPTMTLLTDTAGVTVDLEYNRDINKVIADILTKLG